MIAEFFSMGGFGFYIWTSFGLTFSPLLTPTISGSTFNMLSS